MGKTKVNAGTRKAESRRSHGAISGDRCAETLLLGHGLMVIHRLIDMGQIKIENLARKTLKLLTKWYCK